MNTATRSRGGKIWLIVLAVVAALAAFFLEILIDNNFARVKWQIMLKSAWAVALVAGGINIAVHMYL